MKKVLFIFAIVAFSFASCTPETIQDDNTEQQYTDKGKNCPPNDTNCNGIPDNQEG